MNKTNKPLNRKLFLLRTNKNPMRKWIPCTTSMSRASETIQEGEVIRGHIVQVSDDFVMVDIGYKSEGQISIHEFRDESGKIQADDWR